MKIGKKVAGLAAMLLATTSLTVAAGAFSPAQAASGTISYNCATKNGLSIGNFTNYTNVNVAISVTPSSVSEGGLQTIRVDLGGNGTTASGPSPFNNGPVAGSTAASYNAFLSVQIDSDAPIDLLVSTPASVAAENEPAYPKGMTASKQVSLDEGAHTVKFMQLTVDSAQTNPWPAAANGATTASNMSTYLNGFDVACNTGTTQATIAGNSAPYATTPGAYVPASAFNAASTAFTVTAPDPTQAISTTTTVSAAPVSPVVVGTSVAFTAAVEPVSGSGSPGGTVQFKDGSTNLGSPVTVTGKKATVTAPSLSVGSHAITAAFTSNSANQGAAGFKDSATASPFSFVVTAVKTTAPVPTESESEPISDAARTGKKTLAKVYCETYSKAALPGKGSVTTYDNWPATITVSPGAAQPGDKVKVTVSLNKSPDNGPATTLDPGAYKFQPAFSFEGKTYTTSGGTQSQSAVPPDQPIFKSSQLPVKASSTITLPDEEGDYKIKLVNLNFNNVVGSIATAGMTDPFDNICNASTTPNASPKAFNAPTVTVTASNDAEGSDITSEDDGDTGDGGVLAATGPKETLALGLLALLVLQIGVVMTVRSARARPRTSRGPRHL